MGTYLHAAPQVNWPAREDHGVKYSATWQTIAIWEFWKDYPLQLALREVARAGGYEVAARDEWWPEVSEDSFGKMVLPVAARRRAVAESKRQAPARGKLRA